MVSPRLGAERPPAPVEHILWTAVKDTRGAILVVRVHPLGQELRCLFDGSLLWSEVHRPGAGRQIGAIADEHKAAWIAKGWTVRA